MSFFTRRPKVVDERVESLNNRIYREGFTLAMILCALSITVQLVVNGSTTSLASEYTILLVPLFYVVIKSVRLGLYSDEVELHNRVNRTSYQRKSILMGLGAGVLISLYFGVRSAVLYGEGSDRLLMFTLSFFGGLIIYLPLCLGAVIVLLIVSRPKTSDSE